MSSFTIRILGADDHPFAQGGLEKAIAAYPNLELVGMVGSFQELMKNLPAMCPDVLIMDLGDMGGPPLSLMERLKREFPQLGVIVFSSSIDLVPEMIKAGARGYVAKEEQTHHLVNAILVVHAGQQYLSPHAQEYLARSEESGGPRKLSERQETIIKYLAQGLKTEQVANLLSVAPKTVLNQITLAKVKIGCDTRGELVDWYQRNFLGTLPRNETLSPLAELEKETNETDDDQD